MAHDSKEPKLNSQIITPEVDKNSIYLRPYARHVDPDSVVYRIHGSANTQDASQNPAIVGAQLKNPEKNYSINIRTKIRTNDCEMFDKIDSDDCVSCSISS